MAVSMLKKRIFCWSLLAMSKITRTTSWTKVQIDTTIMIATHIWHIYFSFIYWKFCEHVIIMRPFGCQCAKHDTGNHFFFQQKTERHIRNHVSMMTTLDLRVEVCASSRHIYHPNRKIVASWASNFSMRQTEHDCHHHYHRS